MPPTVLCHYRHASNSLANKHVRGSRLAMCPMQRRTRSIRRKDAADSIARWRCFLFLRGGTRATTAHINRSKSEVKGPQHPRRRYAAASSVGVSYRCCSCGSNSSWLHEPLLHGRSQRLGAPSEDIVGWKRLLRKTLPTWTSKYNHDNQQLVSTTMGHRQQSSQDSPTINGKQRIINQAPTRN